MVRAVTARCRRAGDPIPDVVVVSMGLNPVVGSRARRPRPLAVGGVGGPSGKMSARIHENAATNTSRLRHAAGGHARIATPDVDTSTRWEEVAPFLNPVTLSISGVRPRDRTPHAKRRLGLDDHDKVALVFGTAHHDKDLDLVAHVFAGLPDWQLIVAGQAADEYLPPRERAARRSSSADTSAPPSATSCTALPTSSC